YDIKPSIAYFKNINEDAELESTENIDIDAIIQEVHDDYSPSDEEQIAINEESENLDYEKVWEE
ncbi:hypothetical protein, partial [Metamycoplasma equirhinis]